MRILLVGGHHHAQIRGRTVAIHGLAHALRDRGHEVTLLHAARPEHRVRLDGIRILYLGVTRKSVYPLIVALRRLRRYDVIHANDESGAWLAVRSRVRGSPLVVQLQPPRVKRAGWFKLGWRWRYISVAIRNAPLLLTPSRWLAREVANAYGLPASRICAVPYGIGDRWFQARIPWSSRSVGPPRIALVNMKGVDVALRAFAEATAGHEACLELYGAEKRSGEAMEFARNLGIGDRVKVHGFVDNTELPERIAEADLLLHPTRSESFGQVLGEAAALGIPVVSTRVNAVPEIVEDGETGVLCPIDDVEAFASALRGLLDQPERRRKMAESARQRADSLWRWDRVAARIEEDVYQPLRERWAG